MKFTYWGDLLGFSGYYGLNLNVAKTKLNDFYNTAFGILSERCRSNSQLEVIMFSDCILIYGEDVLSILSELGKLYLNLINKGLLLRGGMVKGKLRFEPRYTIKNFTKQLPDDDTLARAVGLANTKKGARLLLERELAAELLEEYPDWLTNEGYIMNAYVGSVDDATKDILRKIAPTPEQDFYEYLYFGEHEQNTEQLNFNYHPKIKDLEAIRDMLSDNIAEHYKETIALLRRCKKRQSYRKN
jgi:hypothetical protein